MRCNLRCLLSSTVMRIKPHSTPGDGLLIRVEIDFRSFWEAHLSGLLFLLNLFGFSGVREAKGTMAFSATPRVLFVCYGGGHAAMVAPVVAELRRRRQTDPVVLALTTAANTFRRWGLDFRGYADYLDPDSDADAVALGMRLVADVSGDKVGVNQRESVAYMGLSMRDLIQGVGEQEAWRRYAEMGRHAFLQRGVLRRIIQLEQPSLIVATNSPKSERAAILVGNEIGLPTLMMPDLFVTKDWEAYWPFEAKWYTVMCEQTKWNLRQNQGVDSDRIFVTGQPAFDKSQVPPVEECRKYMAQQAGVPAHVPCLLVATSWDVPMRADQLSWTTSNHSIRVVRKLVELAPAFPDFYFLVKPHPSEPREIYSALVETTQRVLLAPSSSDTNQLLRGSVAMIAASVTTTVMDALSLDRSVMICNLTGYPDSLPYEEMGVLQARNESEIEAGLRRLFLDSALAQRQAEARRWIVDANSRAIQNVSDVITALAHGRPLSPDLFRIGLGTAT